MSELLGSDLLVQVGPSKATGRPAAWHSERSQAEQRMLVRPKPHRPLRP
jgi:hypothetical protein